MYVQIYVFTLTTRIYVCVCRNRRRDRVVFNVDVVVVVVAVVWARACPPKVIHSLAHLPPTRWALGRGVGQLGFAHSSACLPVLLPCWLARLEYQWVPEARPASHVAASQALPTAAQLPDTGGLADAGPHTLVAENCTPEPRRLPKGESKTDPKDPHPFLLMSFCQVCPIKGRGWPQPQTHRWWKNVGKVNAVQGVVAKTASAWLARANLLCKEIKPKRKSYYS